MNQSLLSGDSFEDIIEKKGITLRGTPLYLDMQATTPMDPRVLDAMLPYMMEQVVGNAPFLHMQPIA